MRFKWARPYEPRHPFMRWLDERLPLPRIVYSATGPGYPVPRNINCWWNFGALAPRLGVRDAASAAGLDQRVRASRRGRGGGARNVVRVSTDLSIDACDRGDRLRGIKVLRPCPGDFVARPKCQLRVDSEWLMRRPGREFLSVV